VKRRGQGSDPSTPTSEEEREHEGSDPAEPSQAEPEQAEPQPLDSGTVSALRQADPHTRARTLLQLQRLHGNDAVQRVIRSLQVTDAGRDARVQAIGDRADEPVPSGRLEKAVLYREAIAAELDASPTASKNERDLVQDNVNTIGQIFANYQAALHLFEEAVVGGLGETVPRQLALEVLQEAARGVFEPVLEACAGVAPGLEDVIADGMGSVDEVRESEKQEAGQSAPAYALRNLVIAERHRVATTHGRLIKGQVNWMRLSSERVSSANADGAADYRAMLAAAAGRLDELETGSHSAGALFTTLIERWQDLVKGRADVAIVLDEDWTVVRAHVATKEGRRLASQLLGDAGGFFDLNELHLVRHVVWNASDTARLEAVISPEGRPLRFDRNEKGAQFMSDFQSRLRNEGLPRTKVLSGD
jgi:hypothetical protein